MIFHENYSFQTDHTFLSSLFVSAPSSVHQSQTRKRVSHLLGTAVLCHSCFQHPTHEVLGVLLQARMGHTRMGHIIES